MPKVRCSSCKELVNVECDPLSEPVRFLLEAHKPAAAKHGSGAQCIRSGQELIGSEREYFFFLSASDAEFFLSLLITERRRLMEAPQRVAAVSAAA